MKITVKHDKINKTNRKIKSSDAVNPDLYITEDDVTSTMLKSADDGNILEIMKK